MATKEEVLGIAELARLQIPDEELEKFTEDFNSILDYVQQLERLDLSNIEPMSHAHGATNVFRCDEVLDEMTTEAALQNAPETVDFSFAVPLIIDQGSSN